MKFLYKKIFLLILILFIFSCSQKEKVSIIKEKDVELQMIESFKEGYKELEDGDALFAAKSLMKQNFFIHNLTGHQKQL